ncbi:hypothetical protein HCH15_03790 [Corynebacterium testudinoris]|uniref:Uncharacterized protein n=1 Tax=Corynebacterium testudinoris TaxID=136857 RepID=A0A0G3H7K2_9CORY|nr:hypothetical protein [Corynebacterium testudinoris]AKK09339.1 hypothetical protein CTEST_09570 [Corynebacterium testudinoris]MBX8995308.1 hypothetical protein [Corynebacterium testudinoris]
MTNSAMKVAQALKGDLFTRENLLLVGAAATVGVLGIFGGFAAAEPEVERAELASIIGEPVAASPVEVTVLGTEDGMLRVRALNTGVRPVQSLTLGNIIEFPGAENSTYASMTRDDGFPVRTLNPGVPVDILIPVAGDSLAINSMTWRQSRLDGSMQWFDPTPVMEVSM